MITVVLWAENTEQKNGYIPHETVERKAEY